MNAPFKQPETSRRGFLIGAAMVGGALVVGPVEALAANGDPIVFGPFVKIAADGSVTVVNKHQEMGQGNHVGVAALVCEELDADWTKVSVVHAPADSKVYKNFLLGVQGTGGSSAIANSYTQMRQAGAAARAMLVGAAAQRWNVPAGEITVKDGVLSHGSKRAGFGELIEAASHIPPPQDPPLKDPKSFTLVGTTRPRRKDTPAKTRGQIRYTQDVQAPGLLVAMIAHSPRFGGKAAGFDDSEARKVKGVVEVVQVPSGVAVLADTTWAAKKGRDALKVTWDDSAAEKRSSDQILAEYKAIAAGQGPEVKTAVFETHGDATGAFDGELFEAEYSFPFLAHAAMEPMNCSVVLQGTKAKLTFGCQSQGWDQPNVAKVLGVAPETVEIDTLYAGGSFGRRSVLDSDYVVECVEIAKAAAAKTPALAGRPVKLIWTREDDTSAGKFRPLCYHKVQIKLAADGYPAAWRHRLVVPSLINFPGMPMDPTAVEGVQGSPYMTATPVTDAKVYLPASIVPVSFWRSVGATHAAMAMEHTIDQLARKAGKDPAEYRRELYRRSAKSTDPQLQRRARRHLEVLDLVIAKSDWGKPTQPGWTRTIAVNECFGTVVGQVADVTIKDGTPHVSKVVTALDCGVAVTPDQIAAQMESGVCYGLGAALWGQVTLKDGVVEQRNFDRYRVLRHDEAPLVETHILPSAEAPSGTGEPGTPLMTPLVAGAILNLTGKATNSLPLVKT